MNAADLVESRLREAMRTALRYNCTVSTQFPLRRDGDALFCDPIGALALAYDHKAGAGHDSESEAVYVFSAQQLNISLEAVLSIDEGWDHPDADYTDAMGCTYVWERVGARLAREFPREEVEPW